MTIGLEMERPIATTLELTQSLTSKTAFIIDILCKSFKAEHNPDHIEINKITMRNKK